MIKCVLATDGERANILKVCKEGQGSSDSKLFQEMILEHGKGSICIFDRGLQKRKIFNEFTEQGLEFITRGNSNIRYKIERINEEVKDKIVGNIKLIEDVTVRLGEKGSRFIKKEIRLIKAENIYNGKIYTFLTNIDQLTASEICEYYKKRWSIEVFFKFIKQELNMKHFLGRNKNAIMITLYMILIASILLLEYKKRSKILSYKFVRRGFINELKLEVLKPIIQFCGGNPEKIYDYYYASS